MARQPRGYADPFSLLQHEINRLFEDALRGFPEAGERRRGSSVVAPSVDMYEDDQQIVVKLDLPGVDPNAIDLTVDEGVLVVRGERAEQEPEERVAWHARERWRGRFSRAIPLSSQVDVDRITANMKNGVLTVTLPKKTAGGARHIKIQAG